MATEAEDRLQRAAMDVLQEKEMLRDGDVLGDFIMMCEISNFTGDGTSTTYANILPPDRQVPSHRIVGLIDVCSDLGYSDE